MGELLVLTGGASPARSTAFSESTYFGKHKWNVFKYAPDNDLCTEESYPYQGVDTIPCFWNDPTHSSCVVAVKKGAVAGYKDVEVGSLEDMMSAVAQQPVSVAVGGSGHWSQYHGGVFTDCE